jgi:hypothetical protein
LRWSIGDAQGGYVIGRWVNGSVTQLPASGPLQYWRSDYSDEHMVSRTFNCYFVVPVDALGSLGHSTTACIVPGFQSPGHFPTGYQIRLDEPNTARLAWYAPLGEWTGWALVAHPMVRGSTARTILLDHDAASFADDTGGVTTCYVLFVLGTDGAAIGNSEPLCVIPGFSTIAPRGMAPVAGSAAGPSPIQADVGALRSAIEDARALLQLRR